MRDEHEVRGLLLAGGRSRRMGTDKRLLRFGEETLIARAYRALAEAFGAPWVLVAEEEDIEVLAPILGEDTKFLLDPSPGAGPLPAVAAALEALDRPHGFVLATDMPGVTGAFLRNFDDLRRELRGSPDAVVAIAADKAQVTCAFYRRSLAPSIWASWRGGAHCLAKSLRRPGVRVHYLDPEELALLGGEAQLANLNTPADHESYRKEYSHGR